MSQQMLCLELLTNLLSDTGDMCIVLGNLHIYLVLLLCRLYNNPLCRGMLCEGFCACVCKDNDKNTVVCHVTFLFHLSLSCNTIAIHFTHAAIIATINNAIQLHIRRLKHLGILRRSRQSCHHIIHGRVHQVGGNELTS